LIAIAVGECPSCSSGRRNVVDRAAYISALRELDACRADLQAVLEVFGDATGAVANEVESGRDVAGAVQELHWVGIRRDMEEAFRRFHQALYDARCRAVAIMVDDEGLSLSEIARRRGLSRQLISRLYKHARQERSSLKT
jgi:DNA-directed RNA polymerase specialized sigma24 family protein